jgi:hypothetical protein
MTIERQELLGGWRLVRWSIDYGAGRAPQVPYGEAAGGLLLYGADGWMTATMHEERRTPLSHPSARLASNESRAAAMAEYLTYGGRWHLDGSAVIHEIAFALNPVLIGTTQRREAELRDGLLHLTATETLAGRDRLHRIVWRRGES